MKFKKRMESLDFSGPLHGDPDKNERFVLRKCAVYLERLLGNYQLADRETMLLLTWILGAETAVIGEALLKNVSGRKREKLLADWEENISDPDEAPDSLCRILRNSDKKEYHSFAVAARTALSRRHKDLDYSGRSDIEKKLRSLSKMFGLTEQEIAFVEFLYIVSLWQQAENYFVDHLCCQDISGWRYLKTILQMTECELAGALSGTPERIGLYEMDRHTFSFTDDFLSFFQKPLNDLPANNYFSGFSRKTIPLESHLISPQVTENILNLLSVKRESANHILLYGPPGTGKTSYALGLTRKLKVPVYEILREEGNTTSKRRAAILACLNMTNGGDGSLIVVDEADNLLNTQNSWFSRGETQDKGWLNHLLEEPGVRMIWITNNISEIESSVLRRFAFSVHFQSFNRRQRLGLWESVLRRHRVRSCFHAEEIDELAARYPVSAAIIDLSIRKTLETSSPKQDAFKKIMTMNLDAHATLLNDGIKPRDKETIEADYSLDGLHIEGDLPVMMTQLEAFNNCLRRNDKNARNFNLLFYGPPGAGKSELARYIAKYLGRELMVRRASDILSPYVGVAEQNIGRIFYEAEALEAVLVIDEADSFLFSRDRAVRSWEISQTNEFLTQMERFRGILICTTNRFADLDQASVRRFNCKIGFRCLKPEGNLIFYQKLLSPLAAGALNQKESALLGKMDNLTPGDFRVVRDRFVIFPPEQVSHDILIKALAEEGRIKKNQSGRKPVGFMATGL